MARIKHALNFRDHYRAKFTVISMSVFSNDMSKHDFQYGHPILFTDFSYKIFTNKLNDKL